MTSTSLAHEPALVAELPAHAIDVVDSIVVANASTPVAESPAPMPGSVDAVELASTIEASSQGTHVAGTIADVCTPSEVSTSSHGDDARGKEKKTEEILNQPRSLKLIKSVGLLLPCKVGSPIQFHYESSEYRIGSLHHLSFFATKNLSNKSKSFNHSEQR
ncbi:hypothetical protein V6N11_068104 [Hibiscus sabdariffa]|uniref:Uncharacterized protein n=1 Tax=Hibiscus sabdariffa TaxID=183260 RepID=A0ABR2STR0_9ROSI